MILARVKRDLGGSFAEVGAMTISALRLWWNALAALEQAERDAQGET